MDDMKMLLHDEILAPAGFADGVMDAIEARKDAQRECPPIYTPAAKGILCIAAAVILLILSMPKLDGAWTALADLGKGLQASHERRDISDGEDGLSLPAGPVLYVSNIPR